jgi:hypothetical protein
LPEEETLENRIDVVMPIFEGHHSPVGEDDNSPVRNRCDSFDHFDLVGGQIDRLPVDPLRFDGFTEAGEDDRDVRPPCDVKGVLQQLRSR